VSFFKRLGPSHIHVRTPIMIGLVILLVLLISAVCHYRVPAGQWSAKLF